MTSDQVYQPLTPPDPVSTLKRETDHVSHSRSPRDEWVWMPHAAHLIVGADCRFHLATKVGDYLVSTVGEYWPDREIRRIHAQVRNVTIEGRGDEWDANYMRQFGFTEIGLDRKYETMVFPVKEREPADTECCPWTAADWGEIDSDGYNHPAEAYEGHLALCEKYATEKAEAALSAEGEES